MKSLTYKSLAVLAILSTMSSTVLAQYVWLDEKGNKQFSDQPPPPSVPKNKILKFSGKTIDQQNSSNDLDANSTTDAKSQPTLAEKDLASKKRRDELAIKAKKDAEIANQQATKADSCKRMQEYKLSLDSGQRISQFNTSGEKSYLTDEQRTQEQATINQKLNDCN